LRDGGAGVAGGVEVLGGEDQAGRLGVDEEVEPFDGGTHHGTGQDLAVLGGDRLRVVGACGGAVGGDAGGQDGGVTLPCGEDFVGGHRGNFLLGTVTVTVLPEGEGGRTPKSRDVGGFSGFVKYSIRQED